LAGNPARWRTQLLIVPAVTGAPELDDSIPVGNTGNVTRIVYLDQNAWVVLARGAWDMERYPTEHTVLREIVDLVRSGSIIVPLSFANMYETSKINVPGRRANMARTQSLLSGGRVFRGRGRILGETLAAYIADRNGIARLEPDRLWFLSDLWFEAASDYSQESYGVHIPQQTMEFIRREPALTLFGFLAFNDEDVRLEAVRRYSAGSAELIGRIEARRALVAGEPLALRRRAYGAQLVLDELDCVFATARGLGLDWSTVGDIGSSLLRGMTVDVPVLNVERELVVRLEDQGRSVSENDLRDMMAFMTVLPLADMMVAEKQFVNLSRQARLDERYATELLTSIHELTEG